jgi:hypothetical protein
MDQRHMLFQLVLLPSCSSVWDVAKAHSIKVETLWMLNDEFYPTGQLPPTELTDQALFFKTLPLQ